MLTKSAFYKHMKNWVSTDDVRPVLQHIWFDGELAFATNTNRCVIVKNWPAAEPHFETPDGQRAKADGWNPVDFKSVIPKEDDVRWSQGIRGYQTLLSLLDSWKMIFGFLKKLLKGLRYFPIVLQKREGSLTAYAVDMMGGNRTKIILFRGLAGDDWEMCFNVESLLRIAEILRDSEPDALDIRINKSQTIATFETPDMTILSMGIRLGPPDNEHLRAFLEEETKDTDILE